MREDPPGSGRWRGDLWHQGRRTKLTFRGTAKEAKAYEARRRLEIEQRGIIRERDVPTFEEFLNRRYEPMAQVELRDWNVRRYKIKPIRKHFGASKLTKITEQCVENYKQWRVKFVARVTVNGELNLLSAILTYARYIRVQCAVVKIRRFRVKTKRGRVKTYTRTEVGFILAACAIVAPSFLVVVKFLFETGCRKSEAINLPWTRVMFDQRLVMVWNAVDDDEDEGEDDDDNEDEPYQVKSREREVTLSDGLLRALKEQKLKAGASEWVFPVLTDRMHSKGRKYAQFPKHTWARVLTKANELAKKADPTARKIAGGPHRCRHTFASHFLQLKPDLFALGRLLGHSHARVTELYSHMLPEHLGATRNVVTFEPAVIARPAE